jgi:hypothetical protein
MLALALRSDQTTVAALRAELHKIVDGRKDILGEAARRRNARFTV